MVIFQKILYFFMGKMIKLISQEGKVGAAEVLFGKFQVNTVFGRIWIFQRPSAVCEVFRKHFTYRIWSINDPLHQRGTPEVLGSIKSKHNQQIGGKYINQQITNSLHPMSFGLQEMKRNKNASRILHALKTKLLPIFEPAVFKLAVRAPFRKKGR